MNIVYSSQKKKKNRERERVFVVLVYDNVLFSLQKITFAAARQSQFLLWKVKKPCLQEHVLDEMFHAALNLSQRVAYEREKEIFSLSILFGSGNIFEELGSQLHAYSKEFLIELYGFMAI
jgi:hypothetical protein